jgi:hypothetical protein
MKLTLSAGLSALLTAGATLVGGHAQGASSQGASFQAATSQAAGAQVDAIIVAVADSTRPEGDRSRDAARNPIPKPAASNSPTTATTMRDGQHDFDFNIGMFKTHIKRNLDPFASNSKLVELDGTVSVRRVWGGKAELEEIEADGPKGHWEGLSLFLYNPAAHQWSQSFVNSKVGVLSPSSTNIGERQDGRLVMIGQDTVNDRAILVRAMWSDIKSDSHQYEESYSSDGGATWVRSFVADLTRLKR